SLDPVPAAQADALQRQLERERPLREWLARIEVAGADDSESCEALARATQPSLLAFHCDFLPRARCETARRSMLRALQATADARAVLPAVQAFLQSSDAGVQQ